MSGREHVGFASDQPKRERKRVLSLEIFVPPKTLDVRALWKRFYKGQTNLAVVPATAMIEVISRFSGGVGRFALDPNVLGLESTRYNNPARRKAFDVCGVGRYAMNRELR